MPMTFDDVRAFLLALPGVKEGTSYGTPSFRTTKRLLARLKEDGDTLGIKVGFDEREMLMEVAPEAFYLTDHYRPYPAVLVRLSTVEAATLKRLLLQAWRESAPKTAIAAYDAGAHR